MYRNHEEKAKQKRVNPNLLLGFGFRLGRIVVVDGDLLLRAVLLVELAIVPSRLIRGLRALVVHVAEPNGNRRPDDEGDLPPGEGAARHAARAGRHLRRASTIFDRPKLSLHFYSSTSTVSVYVTLIVPSRISRFSTPNSQDGPSNMQTERGQTYGDNAKRSYETSLQAHLTRNIVPARFYELRLSFRNLLILFLEGHSAVGTSATADNDRESRRSMVAAEKCRNYCSRVFAFSQNACMYLMGCAISMGVYGFRPHWYKFP